MAQRSFYAAETFDLGTTTVTFTAAGLGAAKYTVGTPYYTRLNVTAGMPQAINNYLTFLWSKGSGTAGAAWAGLYTTDGTKLYKLGVATALVSQASGIVRLPMTMVNTISQESAIYPLGVFYFGFLVQTDSGTNHLDLGTGTQAAVANQMVNADATGNGGLPRAWYSATGSLSALPATDVISTGTASGLLAYAALD